MQSLKRKVFTNGLIVIALLSIFYCCNNKIIVTPNHVQFWEKDDGYSLPLDSLSALTYARVYFDRAIVISNLFNDSIKLFLIKHYKNKVNIYTDFKNKVFNTNNKQIESLNNYIINQITLYMTPMNCEKIAYFSKPNFIEDIDTSLLIFKKYYMYEITYSNREYLCNKCPNNNIKYFNHHYPEEFYNVYDGFTYELISPIKGAKKYLILLHKEVVDDAYSKYYRSARAALIFGNDLLQNNSCQAQLFGMISDKPIDLTNSKWKENERRYKLIGLANDSMLIKQDIKTYLQLALYTDYRPTQIYLQSRKGNYYYYVFKSALDGKSYKIQLYFKVLKSKWKNKETGDYAEWDYIEGRGYLNPIKKIVPFTEDN